MRALMLAAMLLIPAAPAAAQESEIQGVIGAQMQAFRAGDAAAAFEFASPMIKGMFGTPANFGAMVQRGYPMIWAPGEVRFLGLRDEGGRLQQRVMVRDAAGGTYYFDYEMIETPDGWQINGVRPVQGDELNA